MCHTSVYRIHILSRKRWGRNAFCQDYRNDEPVDTNDWAVSESAVRRSGIRAADVDQLQIQIHSRKE